MHVSCTGLVCEQRLCNQCSLWWLVTVLRSTRRHRRSMHEQIRATVMNYSTIYYLLISVVFVLHAYSDHKTGDSVWVLVSFESRNLVRWSALPAARSRWIEWPVNMMITYNIPTHSNMLSRILLPMSHYADCLSPYYGADLSALVVVGVYSSVVNICR